MMAVLRESRPLAPEVRHFDFEVPELERLEFLPGQFVSLTHNVEGKAITRAYSICSPPEGNRFSLCLNVVREGHLSPFLFAMKEGESVAMSGALGTFTIRNPAGDMIWVATGTGVAPFRAMWRHGGLTGKVTLILGARHETGLLYRDEWERAGLDFRPTLSRPAPDWKGRAGHVQAHVIEAAGGRRDLDVYVCGLKAMVDDTRAKLKAMGFDRKRIIHERYD